MSAPLHQHPFGLASPYLTGTGMAQGIATNPSSPHMTTTMPDTRRFSRRASATHPSTGGSLRAHSQPARSLPLNGLMFAQNQAGLGLSRDPSDWPTRRRPSNVSNTTENQHAVPQGLGMQNGMYDLGQRPAEYVGYYVGQSPSLVAYPTRNAAISPLSFQAGLAIRDAGLSPRLPAQATNGSSVGASPSLQSTVASQTGNGTVPQSIPSTMNQDQPYPEAPLSSSVVRTGPLVVNGSVNSPLRRRPKVRRGSVDGDRRFSSSSSSDESVLNTPSSSDAQSNSHSEHAGLMQQALSVSNIERSPPIADSIALAATNRSDAVPNDASISNSVDTSISTPERDATAKLFTGTVIPPNSGAMSMAWKIKDQLSPVTEVRTPSPNQEHMLQDPILPKQLRLGNGVFGVPVTNPLHGSVLSSIPNGVDASTASANALTTTAIQGPVWQLSKNKKRRNKKTVRSENDVDSLNPVGGEVLPLEESLRKGG